MMPNQQPDGNGPSSSDASAIARQQAFLASMMSVQPNTNPSSPSPSSGPPNRFPSSAGHFHPQHQQQQRPPSSLSHHQSYPNLNPAVYQSPNPPSTTFFPPLAFSHPSPYAASSPQVDRNPSPHPFQSPYPQAARTPQTFSQLQQFSPPQSFPANPVRNQQSPPQPPNRPESSNSQRQQPLPNAQMAQRENTTSSNAPSQPAAPPQQPSSQPSSQPTQQRTRQNIGGLNDFIGKFAEHCKTNRGIVLPRWFSHGEGVPSGELGTFGIGTDDNGVKVGPDGGTGGGRRVSFFHLLQIFQKLSAQDKKDGEKLRFANWASGAKAGEQIAHHLKLPLQLQEPSPHVSITGSPSSLPPTTDVMHIIIHAYTTLFEGNDEEKRAHAARLAAASSASTYPNTASPMNPPPPPPKTPNLPKTNPSPNQPPTPADSDIPRPAQSSANLVGPSRRSNLEDRPSSSDSLGIKRKAEDEVMHPDLSPRLPIASSSSISAGNTEADPPHRLRQKVTYEPLQRQPPTDGGYPLDALQCSRLTLTSSRVPVPPSELGQIDIERLSLSLASRVPTEVSYALGVLTLIAVHPYPLPGKDKGNWIGLDRCPEVLEELVELLEEVAFGGEGGLERWEESCQRARRGSAKGKEREHAQERRTVKEEAGVSSETTSSSQPTHQMLVRLLEEESIRPSQSTSTSSSRIGDSSVLPPSQVISAIVNIVHRFSGENLNENNGPLAHDKRLIRLLLALTDVRHAGFSYDAISRSFCPIPSASSPLIPLTELLVIRRDVLLLIHHLAFHLKLQHASFTPFFPASIFDFVASYITDAAPLTYSFLSPNDHTKSLEDRPPPPDLTDALAVFSRLSLIDQEYSFFSTLPPSRLWTLYRSLLLVLPITPAQFHLTGCESWLGLIENVSLCLFNLTYLCPPVIRARIRSDPAGLSVLLRCLRTYLSRSHEWMVNPYAIVCRRIVETFAQINEDVDSGVGGPAASLDFGRGVGEEETRLLKMDFERKRAGGNAGSLMGRDLEPLFVGLIHPEIELFNAMDVLLWKS